MSEKWEREKCPKDEGGLDPEQFICPQDETRMLSEAKASKACTLESSGYGGNYLNRKEGAKS
jgi:hypothetical protein